MKVFCGIDWSERHHDVALVDQDGTLIAKRRIGESVEGFAELLTLLAEAGDSPEEPKLLSSVMGKWGPTASRQRIVLRRVEQISTLNNLAAARPSRPARRGAQLSWSFGPNLRRLHAFLSLLCDK
jgi:hypothetical protein